MAHHRQASFGKNLSVYSLPSLLCHEIADMFTTSKQEVEFSKNSANANSSEEFVPDPLKSSRINKFPTGFSNNHIVFHMSGDFSDVLVLSLPCNIDDFSSSEFYSCSKDESFNRAELTLFHQNTKHLLPPT